MMKTRDNAPDAHTDHEMPRGPRVLLAEDDADLRALLREVLHHDGYRVMEAANGTRSLGIIADAASSMSHDDRIDLIVLDVRMPVHSGMDVLTIIRKAQWRVPVIVMTADTASEVAEQAARLGATAVLLKPFELDEFRQQVARALGRPSVAP